MNRFVPERFVVRRLLAAAVVPILAAAMPARGQHGRHGAHPPLPDQRWYLQCRLDAPGGPSRRDVPLALPSPAAEARLDQIVRPPDPLPPIRVTRYLPQARRVQHVIPDDSAAAKPSLLLAVVGPSQRYDRWLVAGDAARNRMSSLIATWRYMAVTNGGERDALLRQFETEFTRAPTLGIARADGGGAETVAVKPGTEHVLKALGCTVRVRRFLPDFAIDDNTGEPISRSDARRNPAALVEIEYDGKTHERWVFSKFPTYTPGSDVPTPFRVTLRCPVQAARAVPDFMLLTRAGEHHELWTRAGGRCTTAPLTLGQSIPIPGCQYAFVVKAFVAAGRLTEDYVLAADGLSVPALRIETTRGDGVWTPVWLELGKARVVPTDAGPLTVAFGPLPRTPSSGADRGGGR
ncbi:MAG: hypothetical protein ACE5E6_09125 [Phycisphaerae bacterium]